DVHVGLDGSIDLEPAKNARGWFSFANGKGTVGVAILQLDALRDPIAVHRLERPETPFDHHVVVFIGRDDNVSLADALVLARLRAIEHRMAIGVLTPRICEMLKTTRHKDVQRFRP